MTEAEHTTETAPVTSGETETTTSGEAESSKPNGAQASVEETVPRQKFDGVVAERGELRRERRKLRERVEALEAQLAGSQKTQQAPPANESDHDAEVRRLVEQHAGAMIQRELGMPLSKAKTLMEEAASARQMAQEVQFTQTLQTHGLDPNDRYTRWLVDDMAKRNDYDSVGELMEAVSNVIGSRPGSKKQKPPTQETTQTGASVETGGVAPVMQRSERVPRDRQEAMKMTEQGIASKHVSSADVIRRLREKRKA